MRINLTRPSIIKEAENSLLYYRGRFKALSLLLDILLFVGIFYFSELIYGVVLNPFLYMYSLGEYLFPIELALEVVMTAIVVGGICLIQQRKMRTLGFIFSKRMIKQYLIGLGIGFVMFSAAVGICAMTGSLSLSVAPNFSVALFAAYCVGWFFQGMSEEALCRGFSITSVARRNNLVLAVAVNSIAFACLHLGNPGIGVLPMINLTLFGVFASVVFIKTGNIWMVSAIHSVWNLVQGNLYGIQVSGNDLMNTVWVSNMDTSRSIINGGDFGLEGGLGVTIVLVAGILVALYIKVGKGEKNNEQV